MPEAATVGSLTKEVVRLCPAITRNSDMLIVAVNQEYRDHAHVLCNGDEIALIPPVSGGSFL